MPTWREVYTEYAEEFLTKLPAGGVVEQLKSRHIRRIEFLRNNKGEFSHIIDGTIRARESGFLIIAVNRYRLIPEWCKTVGHELGHTFTAGPLLESPQDFQRKLRSRVKREGGLEALEEDFCEFFASLWLRRRYNREELYYFLRDTLACNREVDLDQFH